MATVENHLGNSMSLSYFADAKVNSFDVLFTLAFYHANGLPLSIPPPPPSSLKTQELA